MTQAVNLANFANNLDTSGGVSPSALNAQVPISKGGTNATTAAGAAANLATEFGKLLYPVGSLYFNATDSTNPGTLLGFGTWVAFGAGRVPVGYDSTDPLFDAAEETGGSKNAIVVSHTHTANSAVTDPGHRHSVNTYTGSLGNGVQNTGTNGSGPFAIATGTNTTTTGITVATTIDASGSSGTNANLQPYITVFIWKRTA
jgi:hypothetical protein